MQVQEAMGELRPARVAEQSETPEGEAVALLDLRHHGEENSIVSDIALLQVLEAVAVAVAEQPDGEQRRQHDTVVPAGETGEGVAILDKAAARSVHRHDQLRPGPGRPRSGGTYRQ